MKQSKKKKKGIIKHPVDIVTVDKIRPEVKTSIIMEGIKIELISPDLDGDGKIGGTEFITKEFGETGQGVVPVQNPSELGDAMKELNKDTVEDSRLSGIDFRGRVHATELPAMIALDSLIGMGFIPVKCGILNRVKMRKSVSIDGLGRKEHVEIVVGKRDADQNKAMSGFTDRFKNALGMGK